MSEAAFGVARPAISVEWPSGKLLPNSVSVIRIGILRELAWARIKFEFEEKLAWVSGPGKVPDSDEFLQEFTKSDSTREIVINIGIHPADKEYVAPITVYVFDRHGRQIGQSTGNLLITPLPEPPSFVRQVLQTLQWIAGVERGKPVGMRLLHGAGRLALLATVFAGYHYSRTPDPWSHFTIDMGLTPNHFVAGPEPNRLDFQDPSQEFLMDAAGLIRKAWSLPSAWTIERGFAKDIQDGKLQLFGPGFANLPTPGGALYDFELIMDLQLPPQGSAVWLLRAQPHSSRGYRFTLTNRGDRLYLSGKVIGARRALFGNVESDLVPGPEMPVSLDRKCCSNDNRVRIRITATGFRFTHQLQIEDIGPDGAGSNSVTLGQEDPRCAFRHGAFQIVGPPAGIGPAYEFIRLLKAS